MTHDQFLQAWRERRVAIAIDARAAAAFLSARLQLPFVAIAVIGLGIGLVLWGWLWSGICLGALGIVVPRLIKRGARSFLISRILVDPEIFVVARDCGVLRIEPRVIAPSA